MAAKRKSKVSVRKSAANRSTGRRANRKLKLVSTNERSTTRPKKTAKKAAVGKAKAAKSVGRAGNKAEKSAQLPKKLLEAIERRKKKGNTESRIQQLFSRPVSRRGRRPRNVEYSSNSFDEEYSNNEQELERLEYDTGIRVGFSVDGDGPSFERTDDFDEELDFG